jgi:hypothetical protein
MTTSANGIEEREAKNNHGACWFLQVAEFSRCTGNSELLSREIQILLKEGAAKEPAK